MKSLIKKPLLSEKNAVYQVTGVYVFEVDLKATKDDIRSEVEKFFDVKVDTVNTSICRGRAKMTKFGPGKVPRWKKAFVKLMPGEKIRVFEGA